MSEGLRTLESPRSPRGGQHRRDEAACLAQRVWRGVRARRTFSELFFASVEASLSGSSVPINMFIAGDEEASEEAPSSRCCEEADTTGAVTTSLQEAQTEASYKYNHHILSSAAGSSEPPIGSGPTPSREPPPSVSRWVSVAGVAATPPPMRWASSAGLDHSFPQRLRERHSSCVGLALHRSGKNRKEEKCLVPRHLRPLQSHAHVTRARTLVSAAPNRAYPMRPT